MEAQSGVVETHPEAIIALPEIIDDQPVAMEGHHGPLDLSLDLSDVSSSKFIALICVLYLPQQYSGLPKNH
jgi:hypothetical protein